MEVREEETRTRQIDDIALALPERATSLARLFLSQSDLGISRIEASVLRSLAEAPRRITELAAAESVTQPAVTLLVNRLEQRGWMRRTPDPHDGRAVLVVLSGAGRAMVERMLAEYRALLHEEMATLDDEDVATLARAIDILDDLVDRIEGREP
jgi:DNA-binding MarR family transcriptional regulator